MSFVVRIRGLPFSANADDIINFFKDCTIRGGKRGIYFPQGPNGRSNGEAFIELDSKDDKEKAMAHHNEHMGRRYIEVFDSCSEELNNAMGSRPFSSPNRREHVVRLRGLPYDTEKKEIYAFFNGLEIAPNGIGLLVDHMGRCTGEAYVQFTSSESLARAKEKHMEKIGHRCIFSGLDGRYIEIFESTMLEANITIQRQLEINQSRSSSGGPMFGRASRDGHPGGMGYCYGPRGGYDGPPFSPNASGPNRVPVPGRFTPYGRPPHLFGHPGYSSPPRGFDGPSPLKGSSFWSPGYPEYDDHPQSSTGHSVRMRGLPYSATKEDIDRFLAPLQPVNIRMRFNAASRPTGEAIVDFASHDEAKEAMKKDREKIGSRYIELFLASTPNGISPPSRVNNGAPVPSRRSPAYNTGGSQGSQYNNYPLHDDMHYADDIRYNSRSSGTDYNQSYDNFYNGTGVRGSMTPSGDGYSDYRYRQGNPYCT
ncbi:Heterogeneous nuclear ribonucleoprotein F [Schistosoma japonicum]|nr:Heterogeneous nuclear ribonucleoprotein F [Schistosoma japonicum]